MPKRKWYYNGQLIEIGNAFHYVGLLFPTKLSFGRMAEDLGTKGKRALIAILQSLSNYGNRSKSAFSKLFDIKVCLLLLYRSELWGLNTYEAIEKVHYYACRRCIIVPTTSCIYGVFM